MKAIDSMSKPYPDFPLYAHKRGYWAKKIRNKTRYFGRLVDGWEPALELYEQQRDDLFAGREPRAIDPRLTLGDLCNLYLTSAEARVASGEMRKASWVDCERTLKLALKVIDRNCVAATLRPRDFDELRADWIKRFALTTVTGHIARLKATLKWAYDVELLESPIRVGIGFKKPSASLIRRERARQPKRLFAASEVYWLHSNAGPKMRAMILLGVNCALGNRDCGELELGHLDLEAKTLDFPRPKNGIERRSVLWPETVQAIREVLKTRRAPERNPQYADRVFLTKYRQPWAKDDSRDSPVTQEFTKLLDAGGLRRAGRNFYALRHTFRTVADEVGDQPAVRYVMGHTDGSIDGVYRERIDDERLIQVAKHVLAWFESGKPTDLSG